MQLVNPEFVYSFCNGVNTLLLSYRVCNIFVRDCVHTVLYKVTTQDQKLPYSLHVAINSCYHFIQNYYLLNFIN